MSKTDPPAVPADLRRSLGLTSAIMVTVGSVIGSGIFLKPWTIAKDLPDPAWILGMWAAIGAVCLLGSFAYAELGAMFPEAGGQYAFLREAWGRFPAFLYGWCLLLVINTGTLAALASAFAKNVHAMTPLSEAGWYAVAAGMILVLAAVNHFGVGWGALVQNLSTTAKLGALGAIVVAGLFAGGQVATPAAGTAVPPAPARDLVPGLVAAAVAIFWTYEGWYQLPFNAAELKNPRRDLPWGLILGLAILVAVYVSVNAIYLHIVPQGEMRTLAENVDVPRTAVSRIFGGTAADGLVVLICISIFGAANPNLLSTPRGIYAMAKDGLVPSYFLRIHPRHRTPTTAIWFQAAWAILLLFVLREFDDITEYVVFAALLFYALTVAGLYVLRARRPDLDRPFRCWGYPLTPAVFVAVVLFVDWQTLLDPAAREHAVKGLFIIAAGVPFYFLARRSGRPAG